MKPIVDEMTKENKRLVNALANELFKNKTWEEKLEDKNRQLKE